MMKKNLIALAVAGACMPIHNTRIYDIKHIPVNLNPENNDWRGKGKRKMRKQR